MNWFLQSHRVCTSVTYAYMPLFWLVFKVWYSVILLQYSLFIKTTMHFCLLEHFACSNNVSNSFHKTTKKIEPKKHTWNHFTLLNETNNEMCIVFANSDTQVEINTMMQFGYSHMPILESEESIKCIHCLNDCLFILFNWTTKHIKYNMVIVFENYLRQNWSECL